MLIGLFGMVGLGLGLGHEDEPNSCGISPSEQKSGV